MTSRLRAQTNSARAQRCPPPCSAPVPLHPDDVTTPCHKQTPRELSAPRNDAPHQSLSLPMTSRLRAQTNSVRAQRSPPPCSAPVPPHPDDVTTPCHKQTPRELSAPRNDAPHQSLSLPMTSRLRAQTNSARAQRSPPPCSAPVPLHPDDVTTPCHKQTPRELSAPRNHAPHQSLSIPMTSRLRDTNKLRESSAFPATMLRTSPSPSR